MTEGRSTPIGFRDRQSVVFHKPTRKLWIDGSRKYTINEEVYKTIMDGSNREETTGSLYITENWEYVYIEDRS